MCVERVCVCDCMCVVDWLLVLCASSPICIVGNNKVNCMQVFFCWMYHYDVVWLAKQQQQTTKIKDTQKNHWNSSKKWWILFPFIVQKYVRRERLDGICLIEAKSRKLCAQNQCLQILHSSSNIIIHRGWTEVDRYKRKGKTRENRTNRVAHTQDNNNKIQAPNWIRWPNDKFEKATFNCKSKAEIKIHKLWEENMNF